METNGTFISFMGSRGSGKTTIANLVFAELEQLGYTSIRQYPGLSRRPLFKSIVTAIYLWRFFDFKLFISLGFRGREQRLFPSLYRLYMPLAFARDLRQLANGNANVLVYDSNILRGLTASVAQGKINPKSVADLYAKKVLSNAEHLLLVVVETDSTKAVQRWVERDGVQLSDSERTDAITERTDGQEAIDSVINELAKLSNVTVVKLDGDEAPANNAASVIAAVTNY